MAETEEAVKVAVRVRCFNKRELDDGSQRIVRMSKEDLGSRTFIKNVDTGEEKEFHFDYSFDSHDKSEAIYATQDIVFNELGRPVLQSALEGKNTCLFAYGQTGAGKSFSMLGNTAVVEQQGIVPRTCREIFTIIDRDKGNPLISSSVSIQVVEIYCEQINDLLAARSTWPQGGHKPRLTKDGYVVDSTSQPCFNYDDIERAFKFADANRSIRAHALNPVSSRAHTIYQIKYEKRTKLTANAQQQETITSRLNLVDLAGSERTESAGTTGEGLKEGNAINLSLTALGNTIKALSEGSRPSYRDSKLTLLLQGSMTNGQVIMIAALSPASLCYEESVSTLRFAERIKQVKVKAKKNVSMDPVAEIKKQMEKMRQEMQEEIEELRKKAAGVAPTAGGGMTAEQLAEVERLRALVEEQKAAEAALREELAKQAKESKETSVDKERQEREAQQKIRESWKSALGGASDEDRASIKVPHLLNLNSEPQLSETLFYKLEPGTIVVGKANKEAPPKFEFSGMGMVKNHCTFRYDPADDGGRAWIVPTATGARTLVNGIQITKETELHDNDRIWLGNNYAFRLEFPGKPDTRTYTEGASKPDYFFCEAEITQHQQASFGEGVTGALGHKLSEALKNVEQANIICQDLEQNIAFQAKIITNRITQENEVVVHAVMPNGTLTWVWDKFNVRLINMVKLWESWQYAQQKDEAFVLPAEGNPFVDTDYQLIGEADAWLEALGNMIEVDLDPPVLSPIGAKEGKLYVMISPLDAEGNEGPWDDDKRAHLDPFVDSPEELLGKEIGFVVKVNKLVWDVDLARGGKSKFHDTFITYKIQPKDEGETKTPLDAGSSIESVINHKQSFKRLADKNFLHHIAKGKITFYVWGRLTDYTPVQVIPPGWKKVTAYQDPEGALHLTLPATPAAPSSASPAKSA